MRRSTESPLVKSFLWVRSCIFDHEMVFAAWRSMRLRIIRHIGGPNCSPTAQLPVRARTTTHPTHPRHRSVSNGRQIFEHSCIGSTGKTAYWTSHTRKHVFPAGPFHTHTHTSVLHKRRNFSLCIKANKHPRFLYAANCKGLTRYQWRSRLALLLLLLLRDPPRP